MDRRVVPVFILICCSNFRLLDAISCFECHGTSVSDATSSCWESVNSEHARFVSLTECGGSCSIVTLNHTSIGLRDFTRACDYHCKSGCFDTPFGTRLCKYCCSTDRCNAVLPTHPTTRYRNDTTVSKENLKLWLSKLFSKPRHHSAGPSNKFHVRHEITKLLSEFVQNVKQQEFEVSESHAEDRAPENFRSFIRTTTRGFNIIAVLPGDKYKTKLDEIIIVMAHYDTASTGTPGVNDNGSGVSSLLELARLLGSGKCGRSHTIVFVSTDFKEHGIYNEISHSGMPDCIPRGAFVHNVGSTNFVCHWLLRHLRKYGGKLSIAINLDSLLNVANRATSDAWPRGLRRTLQNYYPNGVNFWKAMKEKSYSSDWWMVKSSTSAFQKIYSTNSTSSPNLKEDIFLYLQLDGSANDNHTSGILELLHADDCAPFHEAVTMDLPCLTISDTGKLRGYMKRCYEQQCDNLEHANDEKLQNLAELTKILWRFILILSETQCTGTNSVTSQKSSSEDAYSQCNAPLVQKRERKAVFVSATCARSGTIFEMCPTLTNGVWGVVAGDTAWIPRKLRLGKAPLWLQVDFTEIVNITAIAVQGVRRRGYVRSYMVSYGNNERNWEWHIPHENQWEDNARRAEIRGSTSGNGVVKRPLRPHIAARFIRIYPRWWRKRIAMRVQVYGCYLPGN